MIYMYTYEVSCYMSDCEGKGLFEKWVYCAADSRSEALKIAVEYFENVLRLVYRETIYVRRVFR